MKLLIIGPYPVHNNGMSEYIDQYRTELLRRGHEVSTEHMYFWRHKLSIFRWFNLIFRLREGFDAILVQHTPTASGPLLPIFLRAARRRAVCTVVVGHETPSVYAKHLPGFLRPLYHAYERSIFSLASIRVVHTRQHVEELRALGVSSPITVIPIPVYGPTPVSPPPEGRMCWGVYGMISPKKGLDLLLDAYQSRSPGYFPPLHILGGPAPGNLEYVESLKSQIGANYRDLIVFQGYVENERLPLEFSRMSLVIFPYRWVSQSAALAQTCMNRVRYLASDLPYFAEFQQTYGCGHLFKTGSVESLTVALEEARRHPTSADDEASFDAIMLELNLSHCMDLLLTAVARFRKD